MSAPAEEAPPSIPQGVLAPLDIRLSKGQKYPVYTSPGDNYSRSGNGKASVYTNGWVQVFGREGDWLLIQYSIKDRQMRLGYIPAAEMTSGDGIANLASLWEGIPVTLI